MQQSATAERAPNTRAKRGRNLHTWRHAQKTWHDIDRERSAESIASARKLADHKNTTTQFLVTAAARAVVVSFGPESIRSLENRSAERKIAFFGRWYFSSSYRRHRVHARHNGAHMHRGCAAPITDLLITTADSPFPVKRLENTRGVRDTARPHAV